MIAIIGKNKTAVLYIGFKISRFLFIKLHQFMPAEITKRVLKDIFAAEINYFFLQVYRYGCIFNQ